MKILLAEDDDRVADFIVNGLSENGHSVDRVADGRDALGYCLYNSTLRLRDEDRAVSLELADDGPGIPEDDRLRVFEPFYRLDRNRTTKGSGLGLALVKAIAERHGATILLSDNRPGLKVTLQFPRTRES